MSKTIEEIKTEIADLEKELTAHEGYLKRAYISSEAYKKWYAKKQSLLGKIKRREQKVGILMTDQEFKEFLFSLDKKNYFGSYLLDDSVINRFTIRQKNILYNIAAKNHMR